MIARYYAAQSLLRNGINKLPITAEDIENILLNCGYSISYYDVECAEDIEAFRELGIYGFAKSVKAFTYSDETGLRIVFVRSYTSNTERRMLLAHELGHIEMNHISENKILGYKPSGLIDDAQEDEANAFALEFLAPVCILHKKRVKSIEKIQCATLLDEKRARGVADEVHRRRAFMDCERELIESFKKKRSRSAPMSAEHSNIFKLCRIVKGGSIWAR